MTDERERAESLIADLQRVEGLVLDLRSAIAAAVAHIEHLGKAAYQDEGQRGVENVMGAVSVDSLYGLVRQRLHAVGLEALLQRTSPSDGINDTWVSDIARRLRRVVA